MVRPIATLLLTLGLLSACDDDNGYYGSSGAPCGDDRDCAPGSSCEDKKAGGFCTYGCRDHLDCGPGEACVDAHGGSCHLLCADARDCPRGFDCKNKRNEGRGGDSRVCEP